MVIYIFINLTGYKMMSLFKNSDDLPIDGKLQPLSKILLLVMVFLTFATITLYDSISRDSETRKYAHKALLKESSYTYIRSILWMEYSFKLRENNTMSKNILDEINIQFNNDSLTIVKEFDNTVNRTSSKISDIVRRYSIDHDDKIVLFRKGSEVYIFDEGKKTNIKLFNADLSKTPLCIDVLNNTNISFENFAEKLYDDEGTGKYTLNLDSIKTAFVDGTYNVEKLGGTLFTISYINWKRGLLNENILMKDKSINPNSRQIIVVSKINMRETLSSQPAVIAHLGNFNRNAKVVDKTFDRNDITNIILMLGCGVCVILIGIILISERDLHLIKKFPHNKDHQGRRDGDIKFQNF